MPEVDKADITRIHDKIDKLTISLQGVIVILRERSRPCKDHSFLAEQVSDHLQDHKQTTRTFWQNAQKNLWDVGKMVLVALVCFWLANGSLSGAHLNDPVDAESHPTPHAPPR